MNTRILITKELRLLQPAWLAALACALLPLAWWTSGECHPVALSSMGIGMTLLSIRAFGAEFQNGTFSLLLVQPAERFRLWRAKLLSLLLALAGVAGLAQAVMAVMAWNQGDTMGTAVITGFWTLALVAMGGGLFFSLLFRQTQPALWSTLAAPLFLALGFYNLAEWLLPEEGHRLLNCWDEPGAILYGLLGCLGSWWLFRRAQDVNRLEVEVRASSWFQPLLAGLARRFALFRTPGAALLAKELALQQVNLTLTAVTVLGFFLMQVLLRWHPLADQNYYLVVNMFPLLMLFLVVPGLIGCAGVAEERRLGVTLWQRMLPASQAKQWRIKLYVVIGLSLLCGGLLPVLLAQLSPALAREWHGDPWFPLGPVLALSILGLYASSWSRNLLEAAGICLGLGIGSVLGWSYVWDHWLRQFADRPWNYGLLSLLYLGFGAALPLTLLWLAFRNQREPGPTRRLLVRNVLVLLSVVVVVGSCGLAVHHRVWEVFAPEFRTTPGVRLEGPIQPKVTDWNPFYALLPDGRLLRCDAPTPYEKPVQEGVREFQLPGVPDGTRHRWKDIARSTYNAAMIGLRADGTLWSWGPCWPDSPPTPPTNAPSAIAQRRSVLYLPPAQIGTDSDWKQVWGGFGPALAIKQDGSAWAWGDKFEGHGTNTVTSPIRLGTDTDWAQLSTSSMYFLGLKTDGSLWVWERITEETYLIDGRKHIWTPRTFPRTPTRVETSSDWARIHAGFSHNSGLKHDLGVKRDGSLWCLQRVRQTNAPPQWETTRVGTNTHWASMSWEFTSSMLALDANGGLWRFPSRFEYPRDLKTASYATRRTFTEPVQELPNVRWLAFGNRVGLAEDGTLVGLPLNRRYPSPDYADQGRNPRPFRYYLGPSRRPLFAVQLETAAATAARDRKE